MTQSNYDAWVYFQENPLEEPLHQHGAPRRCGGGLSHAKEMEVFYARVGWDAERIKKENEELMRSKGIRY